MIPLSSNPLPCCCSLPLNFPCCCPSSGPHWGFVRTVSAPARSPAALRLSVVGSPRSEGLTGLSELARFLHTWRETSWTKWRPRRRSVTSIPTVGASRPPKWRSPCPAGESTPGPMPFALRAAFGEPPCAVVRVAVRRRGAVCNEQRAVQCRYENKYALNMSDYKIQL